MYVFDVQGRETFTLYLFGWPEKSQAEGCRLLSNQAKQLMCLFSSTTFAKHVEYVAKLQVPGSKKHWART